MFGGKWITEHKCPWPAIFGKVVSKTGSLWQCDCGKRYEVQEGSDGTRVWALVGQEMMTRRDVLDALATVMVPELDGRDLKLWRFDIHQVLTNLEDLGVAGWESTEPVTPER